MILKKSLAFYRGLGFSELPTTEPQTTVIVPASQPPVLLVIEPKATTIEAILPEVYDPWKPFNGAIHTGGFNDQVQKAQHDAA